MDWRRREVRVVLSYRLCYDDDSSKIHVKSPAAKLSPKSSFPETILQRPKAQKPWNKLNKSLFANASMLRYAIQG